MANRRHMRVCDQHVIFSKVTSVASRQNRPAKPRECVTGTRPLGQQRKDITHTHTHTGHKLLWVHRLPKTGKSRQQQMCEYLLWETVKKILIFFYLWYTTLITFIPLYLCYLELCVWLWPHNRIRQTGRRDVTTVTRVWRPVISPTHTHSLCSCVPLH